MLWRIHLAGRDAWHFASGPDGRFNLAAPNGTCYLSEKELGAFVEHFGRLLRPGGALPQPLVDARRLSAVRVGQLNLVDVTRRAVLGALGLTGEIHTTTDYAATQRWAETFKGAGYDGIRYLARHDPSLKLASIAVFGPDPKDTPAGPRTEPIPDDLLREAGEAFSIKALPRRHSRRV